MKVKILNLVFTDMYIQPSDIPKIRGYFATKYKDNQLLHNHLPGGKFSYKIPKIQYRIISRHPALIAFDNGIDVIKKIFFDTENLTINGKTYNIMEKEVVLNEFDFGVSENYYNYKFLSPWMALKEENYKKYKTMNAIEQQQFLKHILRENLKTLSKGFAYTIPNIDDVKVEGYFKAKQVNFKNIKMLCFTGDFTVNFMIPNLMGLGKQSARGFGAIIRN